MLDLTSLLYDLIDEGYIYDTDENGMGMSYGEYMAIANHGYSKIMDAVEQCSDMHELAYTFAEIMNSADDDAAGFFNISDEDRYIYIDDEEPENSDGGWLWADAVKWWNLKAS